MLIISSATVDSLSCYRYWCMKRFSSQWSLFTIFICFCLFVCFAPYITAHYFSCCACHSSTLLVFALSIIDHSLKHTVPLPSCWVSLPEKEYSQTMKDNPNNHLVLASFALSCSMFVFFSLSTASSLSPNFPTVLAK